MIHLGINTAVIGAWFLDMYKDISGRYHAKFDCWQQHFGYNYFYDFMFDVGTSMDNRKFEFTSNKQKNIYMGLERKLYKFGYWS